MRRRLTLLLVLPLAVALSACGSAASSSATDPAAAVPAGVPVYVEVTLRPQGDLRAAASSRTTTTNPTRALPPTEKLPEYAPVALEAVALSSCSPGPATQNPARSPSHGSISLPKSTLSLPDWPAC